MEQLEILEKVDKDKFRTWLRTLVIPWIVKPVYFVQMGFPDAFVRQYVKKHDKAAKPNGEMIRGVCGVSEADFLLALAKAIGADTPNSNRMQSHWSRIRQCAEACLAVLDRLDHH
jgi:hypothetical protein